MLNRWANIFFSLALVFVFILFGNSQDHQQILIGLVLAFILSVIAFLMNWLTIDGGVAAGILGSVAYGVAGFTGAAVILAFFISGSLLSKDLVSYESFSSEKFRRNGSQVWSNGFWFSLWLVIWFQNHADIFLIAAVTSIAAATADTWATEIGGSRIQGKTRLITTGKKVEPGTDGGVSLAGTFSAVSGAVFISIVFWIFEQKTSLGMLVVISLSGFLGTILDSYLGARFQNKQFHFPGLSLIGKEGINLNNNYVNWISAGTASLFSLIIILMFDI